MMGVYLAAALVAERLRARLGPPSPSWGPWLVENVFRRGLAVELDELC